MNIKFFKKTYHLTDFTVRLLVCLVLIFLVIPFRFASKYNYINHEDIWDSLVEQITANISLQQMPYCDYEDIIEDNEYFFSKRNRERVIRNEEILQGGEFYPDFCRARFSTAILVPYRQREEQLHAFLSYMHNFLRQQRIHYRIFLVEQYDQEPFNRAKLFNIGAMIAAQYGFPCLILHDVDLLPLNKGNIYACTAFPRHFSSALDSFRFNLPYRGLFGGVVAITTEQYRMINGMSNLYKGWGGEDDDLFARLKARNYEIIRFEPSYSQYTMLRHKPEKPNDERLALLQSSTLRFHIDGLNSLNYKEKGRRIHSLFTHILVET